MTGQSVDVLLTIRNITDHVVAPSDAQNPNAVGFICASDLTPDGHTNQPLVSGKNFWFVTNPPLDPGETGGGGPFTYTPTDVGKVTCEGVIIASPDRWKTVISVTRLANVPPGALSVTS